MKDNGEALVPASKSFEDSLFLHSKAVGGDIPFATDGGYGGQVSVYSSWDTWDQAIDVRYNLGGGIETVNWASKLGDLSTNSLLVAAIRWFGNVLCSEAPLQVREKKGDEGPGDDSVAEHPLTELWENPNPFYSGKTLKKGLAFSWMLSSQAYILKHFNDAGTEPLELWWEPHWTIRPVWPEDGSEFISYYEVKRKEKWLRVEVDNVIHLRDGLNPYNQRLGFSGIPSIYQELYADREAANYYATLMGGSGTPPFMVALDKDMRMTQPEIDSFTKELIRKTSGKRRGQPIVAKGARAYKLGFNPRELNLGDSRLMAEDRFCAVMGIPAVVLELATGQEHSIYNNVSQAEERAWKSYISPFLSYLEDELKTQLLSNYEDIQKTKLYLKHDLSKVQALQEDQDSLSKRITEQWDAGLITRKEARAALNLGPSDPSNPGADNVFKIGTMDNFLKPGEDLPIRVTETIGGPQPGGAAGTTGQQQPGGTQRVPPRETPPQQTSRAVS